MLFYVDLPKEIGIDLDFLSERVSDIIRSHRNGYHLVTISASFYEWASVDLRLAAYDAAGLRRIYQDIAQIGSLIYTAPKIITITSPDSGIKKLNDRVISVAINSVELTKLLLPPILLVEDLVADGELFVFLLRSLKFPFLGEGLEDLIDNGGGSRLPAVAAARMRSRRIVYAIADSDRLWPGGQSDKKAILQELNKVDPWPLYFHAVTPCRELENIVPIDVYSFIATSETLSTIKVLMDISQALPTVSASQCFHMFFDFKQGLTLEQYAKLPPDSIEWWDQNLSKAGIDIHKVNIRGFGDKIVSRILADTQISRKLLKSMKTSDWKTLFESFLLDVAWTFAASRVIVT